MTAQGEEVGDIIWSHEIQDYGFLEKRKVVWPASGSEEQREHLHHLRVCWGEVYGREKNHHHIETTRGKEVSRKSQVSVGATRWSWWEILLVKDCEFQGAQWKGFKSSRWDGRRWNSRSQELMEARAWEMRLPVGSGINQDKWHNSRFSGFKANSDGKVRNIKG